MECNTPPVIIPMWLTGFDQLMPEGRAFPYKYLPRPGAELSVTFGNPIPPSTIRQGLYPSTPPRSTLNLEDAGSRFVKEGEEPKGWLGEDLQRSLETRKLELEGETRNSIRPGSVTEELPKIRSRVTSIVHDAVEDLGRSVSGRLLCSPRPK